MGVAGPTLRVPESPGRLAEIFVGAGRREIGLDRRAGRGWTPAIRGACGPRSDRR